VETVVARGTWLYDGVAPTAVLVVQLDYDFWFAVGEANGDLAADETPALNDAGHLYYVRHKPGWTEGEPFWPDGLGYATAAQAKAAAEASLPGPVEWNG
jgi:hypothetical protein